jgi:hypothetical protein
MSCLRFTSQRSFICLKESQAIAYRMYFISAPVFVSISRNCVGHCLYVQIHVLQQQQAHMHKTCELLMHLGFSTRPGRRHAVSSPPSATIVTASDLVARNAPARNGSGAEWAATERAQLACSEQIATTRISWHFFDAIDADQREIPSPSRGVP